jgi:prepilin-type N-terminal cleavage/methylation domain-containing protein
MRLQAASVMGAHYRQRGLTLIELLIALAIGVVIMTAFGNAISVGLQAETVNGAVNAVSQDARFAMQRIETAVRLTPSAPALTAKADDTTSADWLSGSTFLAGGVTYCLRGGQLIEKTPWSAACTVVSSDRVIADNVTAFTFTRYLNGSSFTTPVVEVGLTLAKGSPALSLIAHTRVGGGTL